MNKNVTSQDIKEWITNYIAGSIKVPPANVDIHAEFESLGLDSITAVEMTGDLSDFLRIDIEPSIVHEHRSVAALADEVFLVVTSSSSAATF